MDWYFRSGDWEREKAFAASKGVVSYFHTHYRCPEIQWEHFAHLLPSSNPLYETDAKPDNSNSPSKGENEIQEEPVGAEGVLNTKASRRTLLTTSNIVPKKASDVVVGSVGLECEDFGAPFSVEGLTLSEFSGIDVLVDLSVGRGDIGPREAERTKEPPQLGGEGQ